MTMDSDSTDVVIPNVSRNKFDYWLNESVKDQTFEDMFEVDAEIEWYKTVQNSIFLRFSWQ